MLFTRGSRFPARFAASAIIAIALFTVPSAIGAVDENDDQALYPDGGEDEHLHFRISVD